jgi:hypothetical protein
MLREIREVDFEWCESLSEVIFESDSGIKKSNRIDFILCGALACRACFKVPEGFRLMHKHPLRQSRVLDPPKYGIVEEKEVEEKTIESYIRLILSSAAKLQS